MDGARLANAAAFLGEPLDAMAQANRIAARLGEELGTIPGIRLTQKVQTNEVFAIFPREHVAALQEKFGFQVWVEEITEVRLVTSFDTTDDDVTAFVSSVREEVAN
jgi:threonine aldolase